jgi:hypothetical protein
MSSFLLPFDRRKLAAGMGLYFPKNLINLFGFPSTVKFLAGKIKPRDGPGSSLAAALTGNGGGTWGGVSELLRHLKSRFLRGGGGFYHSRPETP